MVKTTRAVKTDPLVTNGDQPSVAIKLTRLERHVVEVPIIGETPLIMQRWSEKARQLMLDAQQSSTRKKKDRRDPEADYQAAFYRLDDGTPGMPATAFKAAIGSAARFFDGITMVALKTGIFVKGVGSEQLVPIIGDVRMREDTPRNANGVADLRYRPEFFPWSCKLFVEYLPTMLDADSVWNLVDASGRCGIGSWRPSSPKSMSGTFGQYRVDFDKVGK
jgi:hypothetical protein